MELNMNYPCFNFPKSVNRSLWSQVINNDVQIINLNMSKSYETIRLSAQSGLDLIVLNLNEFQVFPFNLEVENQNDTSILDVTLRMPGTKEVYSLKMQVAPLERTNFKVHILDLFGTMVSFRKDLGKATTTNYVAVMPKRDPANTGGSEMTLSVTDNIIEVNGTVPYTLRDLAAGINEGNRIGFEFTEPENYNAIEQVLVVDGKFSQFEVVGNKKLFFWYPTRNKRSLPIQIYWSDGGSIIVEYYVLKLNENAVLEPDPNTGGW